MWINRCIKDNHYALTTPVHFVAKDGAAHWKNSSHPYLRARSQIRWLRCQLMLSARSSLYPFVGKDGVEGIVRKETSYDVSRMMTDTL